jgi:hypothetical protein
LRAPPRDLPPADRKRKPPRRGVRNNRCAGYGTYPEIVGEPYRDGDGRLYTPMIREPIFVYGATSVELTRTHDRAVNRGMRFAIYTEPLFKTTNDADNRASVAATSTAALDLVGLGLHADRKTIDKITGGLKFMA